MFQVILIPGILAALNVLGVGIIGVDYRCTRFNGAGELIIDTYCQSQESDFRKSVRGNLPFLFSPHEHQLYIM